MVEPNDVQFYQPNKLAGGVSECSSVLFSSLLQRKRMHRDVDASGEERTDLREATNNGRNADELIKFCTSLSLTNRLLLQVSLI